MMTRAEVQDLLALFQASYPNYNPANKTVAIDVWAMALDEYNKADILLAFKDYMQTSTSGFAPVPGQLIDRVHRATDPHELNAQQAWELVAEAVTNSAYNSGQEFAKLPPLAQKAVGSPRQLAEWALTENLNHEVAKANFTRLYNEERKKQEQYNRMPKVARDRIDKNRSQDHYLAQIQSKNEKLGNLPTEEEKLKIEQKNSVTSEMPKELQDKIERWRCEDDQTSRTVSQA